MRPLSALASSLLPLLASSQFTTFQQAAGLGPAPAFSANSFPFNNFAPSPAPSSFGPAPSFSQGFSPNPGQLEFSNFVDLPSQVKQTKQNMKISSISQIMFYMKIFQRLREPAGLAGPENLSPGCALALPSGGCISYQDVDAAFGQAAESLPFQPLKFPPTGNFSNEEIGSLGTVIHEATRVLAKVYLDI